MPTTSDKQKELDLTKEQLSDFSNDSESIIKDSGILITEELSPNISLTPDGYLLCENACIARIGVQEYSGAEASASGLPTDDNGKILMVRAREEVFKLESIASFNGKPITLDHPNIPLKGGMIDSTDWTRFAKGIVQNTRQDGSLVKADLLITDANVIKQILDNGIRKLSCGYRSAIRIIEDGLVEQTNIVGNHLALVTNPRAGDVATIVDSKNQETKRFKMSKRNIKAGLLKFMGIVDEAAEKVAEELTDDMDTEDETLTDEADIKHEKNEIKETDDIKDILKAIIKRLDVLETADKVEEKKEEIEVKDADYEDEDEDEKGSFAVGDSADKGFISKVEILIPGYRPTGKSKTLNVLKQFSITDSKTLAPLLNGSKLEALSNEALNIVFNSAVQIKRLQNNTRITNTVVDSKPVKADPFAEHYARYDAAKSN